MSIANEAWATKLSEVWDPMTFTDKYEITRADQFNFIRMYFLATTALQITKEVQTFLGSTRPIDVKGRIIFMTMFNDIEWWKRGNEQNMSRKRKRGYRICKAIPVRPLVFL